MQSLDTLIPTRPKAEAARAPAGEEAGARAAPGFEAMLGSFEGAPASAGRTAATEEPAVPASEETPVDPDAPLQAPGPDAASSALQTLMALAGPSAPAPAPAAGPEAGLVAMAQRAAARGDRTAVSGSEAAAPPVSVLGLETHFAPVRPAGLAAKAFSVPEAGPAPASIAADAPTALPAAGGPQPKDFSLSRLVEATAGGSAPTGLAPAPQEPTRTPSAATERPLPVPDAPGFEAGATGTADRPAASVMPPAAITGEPQHNAAPIAPPVSVPAPSDPAGGAVAPTAVASLEAARTAAPRPPASIRPGDREWAIDSAPEAALDPSPSPVTQSAEASDPMPAARTSGQAPRAPGVRTERPVEIVQAVPDHANGSQPITLPNERDAAGIGTEPAAAGPRGLDGPITDPAAAGAGTAPMPALPSPQRQIVDAVAAQLPAAASPVQARPVTGPAEAGPLKILTLQLHPADLGSVLVRMRLQDGRLEMSLRTSREETAERLRNEGGLLSGLLREAGYEPETLTIQAGGTGPGESGPRGQGASFAGSQGGQPDRQPGAATSDHSGRRPSPRADEAAPPIEELDHETDARGRDRGGLYL